MSNSSNSSSTSPSRSSSWSLAALPGRGACEKAGATARVRFSVSPSLRIATWNCNMGLAKKSPLLEAIGADVAVVQECSTEHVSALRQRGKVDVHWLGRNPRKGLGVVVKKPWSISEFDEPVAEWIVRLAVQGPVPFDLFAVWACMATKAETLESYLGQVEKLATHLAEHPPTKPTVIVGDWNSHARWDEGRNPRTVANVVQLLRHLGMKSAYHHQHNERHGQETKPTLFLQRIKEKGYHVDYVFLPESWLPSLSTVSVGDYDTWSKHADHMPLVVDLAFTESPSETSSYARQ